MRLETLSARTVRILFIGDVRASGLRGASSEIGSIPGFSFVLEKIPTLSEGLVRLMQEDVQVVFLQLNLPDSRGLKTFSQLHARHPAVPVVVLSEPADRVAALESLDHGAQDFLLQEQADPDMLIRLARYAVERKLVDQLKDEFVSTISHELRTPLSIIKEGTSLILDGLVGEVSDEQIKILRISRENVNRLAHIIDNMLDIANLDMGRIVLKKQQIDLRGLADKAVRPFEAKIREKGIALKRQLPETPVEVQADPQRLLQVLSSLLENAFRFTSKGSIEISVLAEGDRVICQISDTGTGISEEDLPKLFRRFQQFGRKYGPGEQGTGLGLAIAKQLVELHGGQMQVRSQLGHGTQIVFTLPR